MRINSRPIGLEHPTYFVADIAANHDGDLSRAIDLIHQAADAGADAVRTSRQELLFLIQDCKPCLLLIKVVERGVLRPISIDIYRMV